MIYGSIQPCTITWKEPLVSSSINTVFIKALFIQDLQEQLLLTVSAEKFHREKLNQLTKEKGIQDIMNSTTVDTINNVVSVQYLYNKNLPKLGENYHSGSQDPQKFQLFNLLKFATYPMIQFFSNHFKSVLAKSLS